MKKFQIFRYLQKWKYVILLVTLLGSMFIYSYGNRNQTYTAEAVMEYTNEGAATGKNPDGSNIDTAEINSAAVIADVIRERDLNSNVESIRSRCSISEIIPPEEEEKRVNALKLGQEYSYFPTNYKVSFTVGSNKSKDYARDVLDSILTNYFSYYCEKYVNYAIFPNNAVNISTEQYDYLDCIEMLEGTADEIVYYLDLRATSYPGFRSAQTGYSFTDLKEMYKDIQDYVIPGLYSYVLNNKLVIDRELLVKRYENDKTQYALELENCEIHIKEAKEIIGQFGDKTLEKNDIDYSFSGGSNDGLIVNDVEGSGKRSAVNVQTTYDKLINQYVELQTTKIYLQTKLKRCDEILAVFSDTSIPNDKDSENAKIVSQRI